MNIAYNFYNKLYRLTKFNLWIHVGASINAMRNFRHFFFSGEVDLPLAIKTNSM